MIDDRTPHSNLPLPNAQNLLSEDVERLRLALTAIDEALNQANNTLTTALSTAQAERTAALNDMASELKTALNDTKQQIEAAIASLQNTVNTQLDESAAQLKKTHTLALAGL